MRTLESRLFEQASGEHKGGFGRAKVFLFQVICVDGAGFEKSCSFSLSRDGGSTAVELEPHASLDNEESALAVPPLSLSGIRLVFFQAGPEPVSSTAAGRFLLRCSRRRHRRRHVVKMPWLVVSWSRHHDPTAGKEGRKRKTL
jgi:hypothetical protein